MTGQAAAPLTCRYCGATGPGLVTVWRKDKSGAMVPSSAVCRTCAPNQPRADSVRLRTRPELPGRLEREPYEAGT